MNKMNHDPLKIQELLLRLIEGDINDAGLSELEEWFQQPDALPAYWEFIKNYTAIKLFEESRIEAFSEKGSPADSLNMELWTALAENEKTAAALEVEKPEESPAGQDTKQNEIRKVPPRVSKFSVYSLILSSAALFFIIAYAYFAQISRPVEMATLVDSVHARWADQGNINSGARFKTRSSPLRLTEGYASFLLDNNVRITLEAPSEIRFQKQDRVRLDYGKIYAIVPPNAIGFRVDTPHTKTVDLGTEFGVQEDSYGNTELHVIKGKTNFFAGDTRRATATRVTAESAKKFESNYGKLEDIPYDKALFARTINSRIGVVWRGPVRIDLADIVCGGNGLGSGRLEQGINPVTGKFGAVAEEDRTGSGQYIPVSESRYIDGVFVPDGRNHPVLVSSRGDVFAECPPTNNIYYFDILNNRGKNIPLLPEDSVSANQSPVSQGIFMHANLGITFDLNAIREDFQGAGAAHFHAQAGLSSIATREGHADIWVLVDGKVRYCQKGITEKGKVYPVDVELGKTDRFLTLITTDGGDVDFPEPSKRATDSDWLLFAEPRLELSVSNTQ